MSCPRCESKKWNLVHEHDVPGSDEKISVYECADCGYEES